MSSSSSGPQGLVQSTSTGLDDSPLSDSISFTPQSLSIRTEQNSTGSIPQDSFTLSSQDRPQDSTLPSSQGSVQDSTISTPQDPAISSSQSSAVRPSPESTIPTFHESTTQISQITELIQNVNQHVSEENTAHTQASLDHIILHVTNLVFGKQIYLQELENKCVEIEKKIDTISTLRGEFDVKDATINNLRSQIKEKNEALLNKSNAITALIKSNAIKENKIKELEVQIESKDVALQRKVKPITEVNLSNSTKDDEIKQLEAQVKEKENSIAALKDKLANHIVDKGYPKQEVERHGKKKERRHDLTLRGMAISLIRRTRRKQKLASPTTISFNQSQSHDLWTTSSQEPAKAASIGWSITAIHPQRPRLPRLREAIDTQLLNDGIHGWLSGISESDMRPICSRSQDRQNIG
jgi:hypothetical protein